MARTLEREMGKDTIARVREILEQESQAIKAIPVNDAFAKAADLITACKGKLVTSGMGKAGIIAQKVASTFSSTGTSAVFLHPGEAQHGDLGLLQENDVLMIFSNSGRTREAQELVQLAHSLLGKQLPLIVVSSQTDTPLSKEATVLLHMGTIQEVGKLKLAPTTSTTVMLAIGDALATVVEEAKGFTAADYAKRHHGGYLGQKARDHGE